MVEREYAKAIFDLALEEKKLEQFLKELKSIKTIVLENKDFMKLLTSPVLDSVKKDQIVDKVLVNFQSTIVAYVKLLVRNDRFNLIENIVDEFEKLTEEHNSVLKIEVVSSEVLSKAQMKKITKMLTDKYPNKQLIINNSVSSNILYGIQIYCDGKSIDMSLKNMLNKMKESL